ncbi:MAG TPA: diaminopimelate epimerase [Terriglobia bacterium]|nr:diaminopimelate epimerase [Terriglobia bacterium]
MRITFAKYHAAGNDFIIVRAEDLGIRRGIGQAQERSLVRFARRILARHTGVGADGLFLASPPREPAHHLAVRIFNADGSEAEMSGNGIRCAAAWLLDNKEGGAPPRSGTNRKKQLATLAIETAAGLKRIERVSGRRGSWEFRVNMGQPILDPRRIPFAAKDAKAPLTGYALPLSRGTPQVTVTSMGNPHCSLFVKNFSDLDWRALGREIERHPLFPNRTNVEFVRVLSPGRIEVRFWERGVGETASSGTGSSAAAVAAVLNGLTRRKVRVRTQGHELGVDWARSGEVYLTGPARLVSSGSYEYDDGDAPL